MKRIVRPINRDMYLDWLLKKHYARRSPSVQYAYGVFIEGELQGVVCFGYPSTPFIARGICGVEYEKNVLELNRLVINENVPKNTASFLVGNAMKKLPEEYNIIISFADKGMNHNGYIYQATNFIYCGLTFDRKEWKMKGKDLHSQNVCRLYSLEERIKDDRFELVQRTRKHRYIFFRGSKKIKKQLLELLKYKICEYPKGKNKRYNCIDIKQNQTILGKFLEV